MSFKCVLLAALLLWVAPNQATADEHPVLGQGNITCAAWLEGRQGDAAGATSRTAWFLGYLTAYNRYGPKEQPDVSAGKTTDELTGWLDKYCREHRERNLFNASAAFVEEFAAGSGP